MKKNWPMLVVLGLAGTGCDSIFFEPAVSNGAGGGGSAGAGGNGAGGEVPMEAECTGKPDGTPLAAQTAGDCVVQVCDGQGHARVELSPEDADDFNPCTIDECKNQEAVHMPLDGSTCEVAGASVCAVATCNAGACVLDNTAQGTVVAEQVVGDCLKKQCNGQGAIEDVPDDGDFTGEQIVGDCRKKQCNGQGAIEEVPEDADTGEALECRVPWCQNGVKMTQNEALGSQCGQDATSWCNGTGICASWCNGEFGLPGKSLQSASGKSYAIATGDLNGDGKPDLAYADIDYPYLRVMMYESPGNFATPVQYTVGGIVTSIVIADVDGDNKNDVVVTDVYTNRVGVYINQGGGAFGAGTSYATGTHPRTVIVRDLDGDGDNDIVASNEDSQNVSVLLNQGNGTFATAVNYGAGGYSASVVATDLNGDGFMDLAVGNSAVSNGMSVLLNQGNGTFSAPKNYPTGFATSRIAAADLDGNGKSDLVGSNAVGLAVLLNQGNGNFVLSMYPTGKGASRLTTADLNGDGHLDIASTNYTDGTVSTLLNEGNGTFAKATNYAMGNNVAEVVAADFTGDGVPDLVGSNGTGYLRMLKNDGNGNFPAVTPHYKTGTRPTSIAARDFNDDDVPDLAVANFYDNTVSILRNEGNGTLTSAGKYDVPAQPSTIVTDDFNNDGKFDLAVSESARGYVAVLINQGNSIFAPAVEYLSGAANADAVASADVNGDSHVDLVVAHRNGPGGGTIGVLLGQGDGTFAAPVTFPVGDQVAGTGRSTLGVADLNGDGKPDVVVGRPDKPIMYTLLNDGTGSFGDAMSLPSSAGITFLAIADLTGDSWRDVVVNGTRILKNKGGGTAEFEILAYYTLNAGTVAITDLNGDGKPDMAEANATGAELNVFMNNGMGGFLTAKHYAAGVHETYNGSIVASDLNVDGRPDLAVIDDDGVSIFFSTCMPP